MVLVHKIIELIDKAAHLINRHIKIRYSIIVLHRHLDKRRRDKSIHVIRTAHLKPKGIFLIYLRITVILIHILYKLRDKINRPLAFINRFIEIRYAAIVGKRFVADKNSHRTEHCEYGDISCNKMKFSSDCEFLHKRLCPPWHSGSDVLNRV